MVHSGTFGRRVNQLLQMNDFPTVNIPDDEPSTEIFNVINKLPEYAATPYNTMEQDMEQEDDSSDDDSNKAVEVDAGPHAVTMATQPTEAPPPPAEASKPAVQTSKQPTPAQKQSRQETSVRPKDQRPTAQRTSQPPVKKPETAQQARTTSHQQQQSGVEIGLQFYTYEKSGILEKMPPSQLFDVIREGKVKFTYTESRITEQDILRYIKD